MNNRFPPLADLLWDAWCIASVVGIWPRFIEPRCLFSSKISLEIANLPAALDGFKILHLSDLHIHSATSATLLQNIVKQAQKWAPDLIACTGDFLCYSTLKDKERSLHLLQNLQAPYGCFAVLGNHDYAEPISVNEAGDYDIQPGSSSSIGKGLKRLFSTTQLTGKITEHARAVGKQPELIDLLKQTPFQLLDNSCKVIPIKNGALNVVGLGEYSAGQCFPEKAFEGYKQGSPGLILAHNPDSIKLLTNTPGDLILSGHTHGGQIYLPWIWKKLTLMENPHLVRGLFKIQNKWLYVNRGIGSIMQFRWFAPPELTLITLKKATTA